MDARSGEKKSGGGRGWDGSDTRCKGFSRFTSWSQYMDTNSDSSPEEGDEKHRDREREMRAQSRFAVIQLDTLPRVLALLIFFRYSRLGRST